MAANEYFRGETAEVVGTIKTSAAVAANPSVSTVVRLKDSTGTRVVEDTAMTNSATGTYYYAYDLAAAAPLGKWFYEVITTDGAGSDVSIGSGYFIVKARVA